MKSLQDKISELPEEEQQEIHDRAQEIEIEKALWDLEGVYEDIRAYVEEGVTSVPDKGTLDTIRRVSEVIKNA